MIWIKRRSEGLAVSSIAGLQYDTRFLHICQSIILGKSFGFGNLQTLEPRSKLYFDYTIPLLEEMTAIAKLGAKEYFIYYESIRSKESQEVKAA
jgi:hypothetical protein